MSKKCFVCKQPIKKGEHTNSVYVPVGNSYVTEKVHTGQCLHKKIEVADTYEVVIYDDEIRPAKWKSVVFTVDAIVSDEIYRATLGQNQPVARKTTTDLKEASSKLKQMLEQGWKAKIRKVTA